jgi:predicted nuclease of predicted toxin-antitoxin system
MKVRFQADADFSQRIVSAVRRQEPTIDFQTAQALGLRGLDDLNVLALAAREGRVLVSHDLTTMPDHFAKFVETDTSAGLLIIRQKVSIRRALEELLHVWIESEANDWLNQMRVV